MYLVKDRRHTVGRVGGCWEESQPDRDEAQNQAMLRVCPSALHSPHPTSRMPDGARLSLAVPRVLACPLLGESPTFLSRHGHPRAADRDWGLPGTRLLVPPRPHLLLGSLAHGLNWICCLGQPGENVASFC